MTRARRDTVVDDPSCTCGTCHDRFPTVEAFDQHRRRPRACVPTLPLTIPALRRPARNQT